MEVVFVLLCTHQDHELIVGVVTRPYLPVVGMRFSIVYRSPEMAEPDEASLEVVEVNDHLDGPVDGLPPESSLRVFTKIIGVDVYHVNQIWEGIKLRKQDT